MPSFRKICLGCSGIALVVLLAGLGLNNKTAVVVLLFAILLGVLLVPATRGQLRTAYPWLGGLIAMLLWLPNLVWQARNGWPVFALGADIADEFGGITGRLGLLLQALAMFSPLIAIVWVYGLVRLFRDPAWVRLRPIGWAFLVATAVFLIAAGKGYYLAGAIVPLVAAGCTALAARWSVRRLVAAGVVLAVSAAVAWPAFVPVLPVRTYAASLYPALDSDQLETIGWPEFARSVQATLGRPGQQVRHVPRRVLRALSSTQRVPRVPIGQIAASALVLDTTPMTYEALHDPDAVAWRGTRRVGNLAIPAGAAG